jgi:uncharacterized protein YbgA (DUF1722 family)
MAGYLRGLVSSGAKREMSDAIGEYQAGLVPRAVPVALLRHHVREKGIAYLAQQTYLDPFPRALQVA